MRLSCAMDIPCCKHANFVVGVHLNASDASCLVRHLLFDGGDNSWDMVARLRLLECSLQDSLSNRTFDVRSCWLYLCMDVYVCTHGSVPPS